MKKPGFAFLPVVAVALAIVGNILAPIASLPVIIVFCAAALVVSLLFCLRLEDGALYENFFYPCLPTVICGIVAAGLLIFGGVRGFMHAEDLFGKFAGILAFISALCFVGAISAQHNKKKPSPALFLIPIIYYLLQMIADFRAWSIDPIVLDYCFKLFARLGVMLGVVFLGGFVYGKGKRRLTLTLCTLAIALCGLTLGGDLDYTLVTGGSAIWLLGALFTLCRPKIEPSAEPEEAPAQEDAEDTAPEETAEQ